MQKAFRNNRAACGKHSEMISEGYYIIRKAFTYKHISIFFRLFGAKIKSFMLETNGRPYVFWSDFHCLWIKKVLNNSGAVHGSSFFDLLRPCRPAHLSALIAQLAIPVILLSCLLMHLRYSFTVYIT